MTRLRATLALLVVLLLVQALPRGLAPHRWMFPMLPMVQAPVSASYIPTPIKSIQQVSIAVTGTSNTATITSVTTGNSLLVYQGATNTDGSGFNRGWAWAIGTITNATTITASLGVNAGGQTTTWNGVVVEFLGPFVKSSACGSIVGSTGTATITSVNTAKTVLAFTGTTNTYTTNASVGLNGLAPRITLTNSTTISATAVTDNGGITSGYCYVEFK